jgi:hypothetical protein
MFTDKFILAGVSYSWPIGSEGDLFSDWKWDEMNGMEKGIDEPWKDITDDVYTGSEYRGGKSYLAQLSA